MVVRAFGSLGVVFGCFVLSGLAAAQPALADAPNLEGLNLEELAEKVGFTGEFNVVVFVVVSVLAIVGAIAIHFVRLILAKVLVVLLPGLAGVGAAVTVPKAEVPPLMALGLVGAWVAVGVALGLMPMLYATIWDLKQKTRHL